MSFAPTPEQEEIKDAARAGRNVVIEAGAGAGKTSTLKLIAAEMKPGRSGLYMAYNRAIANDAKASFPGHVQCSTAHALAMRAVGKDYRHKLNGPRQPAREVARLLGITAPAKVGELWLAPNQIARLVVQTVNLFCRSADDEPGPRHVPRKPGMDTPGHMRDLAAVLVPLARKAWADLRAMDGKLRFDHDHYLKLWQLSKPQLDSDVVCFDEAQDANPVILDVIHQQRGAQLIVVGDRNQAIYGWRGAIDAMDKFPDAVKLQLSQSFRFGPAVAREANKWLSILDAPLRLRGFDRISSMVRTVETPNAILCRTNAEATAQAMKLIEAGRDTAIVGGGNDIRKLAEAAQALQQGRPCWHPELIAFSTWGEVQDYAENDPAGTDLAVFVRLIDEHGPEKIISLTDRLTDENRAQVVISTAHKAKGREWDSVKIGPDFREPKRNPERPQVEPTVSPEDARLAYVAVTRARLSLDRAGLAWVENYLTDAAA